MEGNQVKKSETFFLGINQALIAFLVSFLLCLMISVLINLKYYEQISMITVGTLGEVEKAGFSSILRLTTAFLGLSLFQRSGGFQFGFVWFGLVPALSFFLSGKIFRNHSEPLATRLLRHTISAIFYTLFLHVLFFLTRGEVFGFTLQFFGVRNIVFTIAFLFVLQILLAIGKSDEQSPYQFAFTRSRAMWRLLLSFSAISGLMILLYYGFPFLKSMPKTLLFAGGTFGNFAILVLFLFMGIPLDIKDSLHGASKYLPAELLAFALPEGIRILFLLLFIVISFLFLSRLGRKYYWKQVLLFASVFSVLMGILAEMSRIDFGYRQGVLSVHLTIPFWKAMLIPFLILGLNSILIFLLRALYAEIDPDVVMLEDIEEMEKPVEAEAAKTIRQSAEMMPEEIIPEEVIPEEIAPEEIAPEETVPEKTVSEEKRLEQIESQEVPELPWQNRERMQEEQKMIWADNTESMTKSQLTEIDIWKSLAERPLPQREGELEERPKRSAKEKKRRKLKKKGVLGRLFDFSEMEDKKEILPTSDHTIILPKISGKEKSEE